MQLWIWHLATDYRALGLTHCCSGVGALHLSIDSIWSQFSIQLLNSLRLSDATWRQRFVSSLGQVMACCLTASSHYLSQCWQIISEVLWLFIWFSHGSWDFHPCMMGKTQHKCMHILWNILCSICSRLAYYELTHWPLGDVPLKSRGHASGIRIKYRYLEHFPI